MTKFQEEEFYDMCEELSTNKKLNQTFQESFEKTKEIPKYKHRPFFDQYRVSFDEAKSILIKGY